jgi:hypothetical protein
LIGVEARFSVTVVPPLAFTTGLGVNVQLIPVGSVAGVQANASSSPGTPVPALMDNGMLVVDPVPRVIPLGTVIAGAREIVTCDVTEN